MYFVRELKKPSYVIRNDWKHKEPIRSEIDNKISNFKYYQFYEITNKIDGYKYVGRTTYNWSDRVSNFIAKSYIATSRLYNPDRSEKERENIIHTTLYTDDGPFRTWFNRLATAICYYGLENFKFEKLASGAMPECVANIFENNFIRKNKKTYNIVLNDEILPLHETIRYTTNNYDYVLYKNYCIHGFKTEEMEYDSVFTKIEECDRILAEKYCN
jgi:hypothetical protein